MQTQKDSCGIAPIFISPWCSTAVDNVTLRLLYPRQRDPVPTVQETTRWTLGLVLMSADNIASTGFRIKVNSKISGPAGS
jgi:hypothetical protein